IVEANLPIHIFTLDTGRLHPETVNMVEVVKARYGYSVDVVRPDQVAVSRHVAERGQFAFYESVEMRKGCCSLRKVEPLRRALAGHSAWLTGQRREQSLTRSELADAEYDTVFGLQKFNPLAAWTETQVWAVVRGFEIPYNPLHDEGYPSIGCE